MAWVEEFLKIIQAQPPCHGQDTLQQTMLLRASYNITLGWVIHNFFGQLPHHAHSKQFS